MNGVKVMSSNVAMSDTALKQAGLACLSAKFGKVNAERIIYLFKKEPFDYTKWHRDWLVDKSVDEIMTIVAEHVDE